MQKGPQSRDGAILRRFIKLMDARDEVVQRARVSTDVRHQLQKALVLEQWQLRLRQDAWLAQNRQNVVYAKRRHCQRQRQHAGRRETCRGCRHGRAAEHRLDEDEPAVQCERWCNHEITKHAAQLPKNASLELRELVDAKEKERESAGSRVRLRAPSSFQSDIVGNGLQRSLHFQRLAQLDLR